MSSEPTTRARVFSAVLDLVKTTDRPLTMGAIASKAGLSRQSLYLLFTDKADLFIGLLRHVDGDRGLVAETARLRAAPDGRAAILALVDLQARWNPGYKPLFDAFEALRRQDASAEAAWRDRQWHRRAGCRAIIARLEDAHQLRPGLEADAATDLLWTLTSVAAWDDLVTRQGWSADRYRDHLSEFLLAGLTRPILTSPNA